MVQWTSKECLTFAPATIAPMVNANVKHNPNANPVTLTLILILILTLPWTKNPIITLTLNLCCWRYHHRSNCRRSKCRITLLKCVPFTKYIKTFWGYIHKHGLICFYKLIWLVFTFYGTRRQVATVSLFCW